MSEQTKTRETIARFADPKRDAVTDEVVGKLLGTIPRFPPLPDGMAPKEKIKFYAEQGFLYRADGSPEDFERLWQSAFTQDETAKGGRE